MKKQNYEYFLEKVNTYLDEHKYDPNLTKTTDVLNPFLKFYKQTGIPISEYTKEKFDSYFKSVCGTPQSSAVTRTVLARLFDNLGLSEISEIVRSAKNNYKMNYFSDFEALDSRIEKVRYENFSSVEGAPTDSPCDSYTMAQVILYLAWIGVPKLLLTQMPLSAINLEEQYVDGGKKYSFADNPKIAEVFKKYKNSDYYIGVNTKKGKVFFCTNSYQGDTLIRTRAKLTTGSNVNITTTLNRIKTTFNGDEAFSYYNVFRSGQFFRGFQKLTSGILPEFSDPDNLWDYFRVQLDTADSRSFYKKEWETYLKWRQENHK